MSYKMKEIVAAQIGSVITSNLALFKEMVLAGSDFRLFSRFEMEFMSNMDLGSQWTALANAPTWFLLDENGKPKCGKETLAQPKRKKTAPKERLEE